MQTKTDISYGVVPVYKDGDGLRVLVVHQISYRGDDFWIFPKGHAEVGEAPAEAASRELIEETGITAITLDEANKFEVSYSFVHEGVRIEKTVIYFLGIVSDIATHISQPHEIKEIKWCTFEEAEALLTHKNSKDVLAAAKKMLIL
jgi:8-oxo-dGTP pyrophosphatase MutT (NUDIX family)